jgi:hypothetical protein
MIQAKPVVENQYWILKKDNQKIGQLELKENGNCTIKILNSVISYKTIKMAREAINIEFEPPETATPVPSNMVYGHKVEGEVFSPLWDVKRKLPLFTKEDNSKSWFAAGWYRIKQHRKWKMVQHPKLITLERYAYQGPYYSRDEAGGQTNLFLKD